MKTTGDILYSHNDIIRNTFWHVFGKKNSGPFRVETCSYHLCPLASVTDIKWKTKKLSCIYFGVIIRIKPVQKRINS